MGRPSYAGLVKRLVLPEGWVAPEVLHFEDVRAEAISRHHLADDVRGINASLEVIRRTRGGAWPSGPVTAEGNYVDLVWHECEARELDSFTYALYLDTTYVGCCYLYPLGRRQELTEDLLDHDVDVSWWVTPEAYAAGVYATVHWALAHWTTTDFPFRRVHYSNLEIPAPPNPA